MIYLKQTKDLLPPRYNIVEFDMRTHAKEFNNNIKLQGLLIDLKDKVKDVFTDY